MQLFIYAAPQRRIRKPGNFIGQDLDPRQISMDPDPDLAETEIDEQLFRLIHHRQLFLGNLLAVDKT